MKIGFDGKRAVQNHTGLGNYSRFIIDILARYYKDNQYVIYAPAPRENGALRPILQKENVQMACPVSPFWKKLRSLWRVWGIGKQLKQDGLTIFHGLSNELPLSISRSGTKSVVTIHDLIFLRYPDFYTWIDRRLYTYKYKKACLNAGRIIAVSEMTKRDIVSFWGIDERKIDVVYQGCHPVFKLRASEEAKAEIREKYRLPEKYIFNVGSMESRKNLLLIVKALPSVPDDISLVAVGKRTPYTGEVEEYIRRHKLSHRVRLFHSVPFQELPAFYQSAKVFVYPSFFEGFGIPVIEAIHSGLPVIAATGSCLEEAGGPDSIYIDPSDEQALARSINKVLASPETAGAMIKKGLEYAERFSDEAIARGIMQVYEKTTA